MSDAAPHVFPPAFDGKRPGGTTVRIADVDALLALASEHAGVPLARLDRRTLEQALHMIGAPPLHTERATMVHAGRARQARRRAMATRVWRTKALGWVALGMLVLAVYGVRLHRRLAHKLASVERAERALAEARRAPSSREPSSEADLPTEAEVDARDDRISSARRRYDDAANDYDAAVRGFPTSPFVRLVRLPSRVPMSWELGARGAAEQ